ncbi:MAG: PepSY-associated TM helix domain-containing protein [Pseudomonadota bacterium]
MDTLRQSMSWMHTWTGLLFGWVLYFMFVTGSSGYYDSEIDAWMQPELSSAITIEAPAEALETALERAAEDTPGAINHRVFLPYTRSFSPYIRVFSTGVDGDGKRVFTELALLEDGSAAPEPRDTAGGQRLYRLHWTFHYIPRALGEMLAGLAAVFMFAAIISGIITHKKIFTDFFTLRLAKGQRSWLDSHNIVSVMTLPFQIMITFSGILLVVTTFFIPIFVAQYGYSEDTIKTVEAEMFGGAALVEPVGEPAELVDMDTLLTVFDAELPGERLGFVEVRNPGDVTATVRVYGIVGDGIIRAAPYVAFAGATGEVLSVSPRAVSDTSGVMDVLEGLHEGLFAGPVLRVLYFVSGLMGAGMIATGLVLWTKKRRQKLRGDAVAERNLVLIERLNVGVVAGLVIAIGAYFYANRLLPLGMADRAEWELHTLFLVWLACIIHALVRAPSRAWIEQLAGAAGVFASLPVLNALTTSLHLGNTLPLPGRAGDMAVAGVDLWFLVIAAGFAYAAKVAAQKQAAPKRARRPRAEAPPAPAE